MDLEAMKAGECVSNTQKPHGAYYTTKMWMVYSRVVRAHSLEYRGCVFECSSLLIALEAGDQTS